MSNKNDNWKRSKTGFKLGDLVDLDSIAKKLGIPYEKDDTKQQEEKKPDETLRAN